MKRKTEILILILILVTIFWAIGFKLQDHISRKQKEVKTEEKNINIDNYNFTQLEKVKNLLKDKKNITRFNSLNEFNKIFIQDIKPIKNCYYVSNYNWKEPYIFWFKLESNNFKLKYKEWFIAYPKYDLTGSLVCPTSTCYDQNFDIFTNIISNPCKD